MGIVHIKDIKAMLQKVSAVGSWPNFKLHLHRNIFLFHILNVAIFSNVYIQDFQGSSKLGLKYNENLR